MGKALTLPCILYLILIVPTQPKSICGPCEYSEDARNKCSDLEERCTDLRKHIATCKADNVNKIPYDGTAKNQKTTETGEEVWYEPISAAPSTRAVTTTTSVTSLNYTPTTATTDSDGGYDALKNGEAQDHCPGYSVAIAAFLSFVAGILTVLAVLFVRRYLRKNKSCLCKNDDASTRTVAGASLSVTAQLDHGLGTGQAHATALNAYEPMEGANMHAAAENPYQTLDYIKPVQYCAENEHVYTGLDGQTGSDKAYDKPQKTNGSQTGQTSGTENTYFVLEKEDSGDAGAQMPLQGSGTDNTYFVLEKEDIGEAGVQVPLQAVGTENTYFVLEKEAQMPPLASGTENTYFGLEKEAQMPSQTSGTENTYFVLEKEGSSDAQIRPKANGADNTKFFLEKEAQLSSNTGGTDNMKTGH